MTKGEFRLRPVAVLQCHPRLACALTQEELDALISLLQMANDDVGDVTFADWVTANDARSDGFLDQLERKLTEIDPTSWVPAEDENGPGSTENDPPRVG
jgi:hypothetical protein